MNKRILFSSVSIFASLALVTGATFAFFSDSGTSSDNVFSSGSFNMQLSDANQEDQESVTSTWGLTTAGPGGTFTGDLRVTNVGSVSANHLELKFDNLVTPGSGAGATETVPLDRVIQITTFGWDSDGDGTPETDLLSGVVDTNGNTIKDLDDLETQALDDFDGLLFGGTQVNGHVLRIAGQLHPINTVNEHQGDSVNMTLTVTMNQDASQ